MEPSEFDELMHRYLAGKVSPEEKLKVEAWLETIRSPGDGDDVFAEADQDRLFNRITSQMAQVDEIINFAPQPKKVRLHQTPWFRVAASVVALLVLALAIWRLQGDTAVETTSEYHGGKVFLQDGSIVWLEDGSHLSYSEDPDEGKRMATLTGAGFFEVAKDKSRPFVITCGNVRVQVLGTSFRLRNAAEQVELNVISGSVNVSSESNPEGRVVAANEKLVQRSTGEVEHAPMTEPEVAALIRGEEYDLYFRKTAMSEVFKKLEQKFEVTFSFGDSVVGKCLITADLNDRPLHEVMVILSEILSIGWTQDGKTIHVTGSGCQL